MSRALLLASLFLGWAQATAAEPSTAPARAQKPEERLDGVWVGEITAPNKRTELGLAFTRTEDGLMVSVHLPEMFLYSANFGRVEPSDGTFSFAPLNLNVSRQGDRLVGTFALPRLPVELRRGGSFSPPPPEKSFPAAPPSAWVRQLDAGAWASPAAFAGTLYVATVDGRVHALRAADGELLWSWLGTSPLYGQPLATEDSVYLVDSSNTLVALNRLDGHLRWQTPLHDAGRPPPSTADPTFNHRAASPVIDSKGILYVGSADQGLYAIRARNGRVVWRHEAGAPIYAPATLAGDRLLVGCFDGSVFSLDRRTRRESMRTKLGGSVVSAPVAVGDRIIVGARDYLLYGLRTSGEVAWRNSFWFSWVESTPRLADGVLYVGGSDYRRVSAIEPATGRELWATDVQGLSWGTPVVTGETVFAGTAGQALPGTVIKHAGGIVALDRKTGSAIWRYESTGASGGFSGFAGSLILVAGVVVGAEVDGTVVAFPAASQ